MQLENYSLCKRHYNQISPLINELLKQKKRPKLSSDIELLEFEKTSEFGVQVSLLDPACEDHGTDTRSII